MPRRMTPRQDLALDVAQTAAHKAGPQTFTV